MLHTGQSDAATVGPAACVSRIKPSLDIQEYTHTRTYYYTSCVRSSGKLDILHPSEYQPDLIRQVKYS